MLWLFKGVLPPPLELAHALLVQRICAQTVLVWQPAWAQAYLQQHRAQPPGGSFRGKGCLATGN
eukprot:1640977-Alexandrium_andersonii.AAC.1